MFLRENLPRVALCMIVFSSFRFVTKLLEDLIFFVAGDPNNGQEVLDVVVTKPNRERQKLMREQNILAQVSDSNQKLEDIPESIQKSCQLACSNLLA